MAYAVQERDEAVCSRCSILLDDFRRTRVYIEASPLERADLENFLVALWSGDLFFPPVARRALGDAAANTG